MTYQVGGERVYLTGPVTRSAFEASHREIHA